MSLLGGGSLLSGGGGSGAGGVGGTVWAPDLESTVASPAAFSTDRGLYGKPARVSQQIPSIARVGSRWFAAWYGINFGPPGTNGEDAGCYVILAYSDAGGVTGSWIECAYFIPRVLTEYSVVDPHMCALPDGRLLLVYPTVQSGRRRSTWAQVLVNPHAPASAFIWGRPCHLGTGFVGRPRVHPTGIRLGLNQPVSAVPLSYEGQRYNSLAFSGFDTVTATEISVVPFSPPGDGSNENFQESSYGYWGTNGANVRSIFRTRTGMHTAVSTNSGATWSAPVPAPLQSTGPDVMHPGPVVNGARQDFVTSATGRHLLAWNRFAGRRVMTLGVSEDNGATFPWFYSFDTRYPPNLSYPSIEFDANGDVCVSYDRGRGEAPSYVQEMTFARISGGGGAEAAIKAGTATVTISTIST